MILCVLHVLKACVDPVVVAASPGQSLPPLPSDVLRADDASTGKGPLQGIVTGLSALSGRVDAAYVSSCDVPLLRPSFVLKLVSLLEDQDIVVPQEGEHYHPLSGVYRLSVLPAARSLIADGRLRPYHLFEQCRFRPVDTEELRTADLHLRSLHNINGPEDYRSALALDRQDQRLREET